MDEDRLAAYFAEKQCDLVMNTSCESHGRCIGMADQDIEECHDLGPLKVCWEVG